MGAKDFQCVKRHGLICIRTKVKERTASRKKREMSDITIYLADGPVQGTFKYPGPSRPKVIVAPERVKTPNDVVRHTVWHDYIFDKHGSKYCHSKKCPCCRERSGEE